MHVKGATGPESATCQKDFNLLICPGSCVCGLPPPPPAPFVAAAPGCGYNTSLFSQQNVPGTGCTCCDAGFDYQESCATQVGHYPLPPLYTSWIVPTNHCTLFATVTPVVALHAQAQSATSMRCAQPPASVRMANVKTRHKHPSLVMPTILT